MQPIISSISHSTIVGTATRTKPSGLGQSVLQTGAPDNEVLLYWPLHDRWHGTRGLIEQLTMHNRDQWLTPEPVGRVARQLWDQGIGFDYASDRLLRKAVIMGAGEISFGDPVDPRPRSGVP